MGASLPYMGGNARAISAAAGVAEVDILVEGQKVIKDMDVM